MSWIPLCVLLFQAVLRSLGMLYVSSSVFFAMSADSATLQAHAMLPHLGGGVAQGIEDVYVLCELLGHPQTKLSNVKVRE